MIAQSTLWETELALLRAGFFLRDTEPAEDGATEESQLLSSELSKERSFATSPASDTAFLVTLLR